MNYYLIKYEWKPFEPLQNEEQTKNDFWIMHDTILVKALTEKDAHDKIGEYLKEKSGHYFKSLTFESLTLE